MPLSTAGVRTCSQAEIGEAQKAFARHLATLNLPSGCRCCHAFCTRCQFIVTCAPPTLHQVDVYTAFHDPKRCFEETVNGPFSVTVAGGWFPRAIAGRAHALCAYIRCALCALYIAWLSWRHGQQYDVIIADQVGAATHAAAPAQRACAGGSQLPGSRCKRWPSWAALPLCSGQLPSAAILHDSRACIL